MDFVGDLTPSPSRLVESLSPQLIRSTIECDPSHDLRMNEVLWAAAHLPNAFVRLPPSGRQIFQYNWPQGAAAFRWRHTGFQRLQHHVGDLAEDVELQLLGGAIANPHRRRVLVSGQPRDGQLRQPS